MKGYKVVKVGPKGGLKSCVAEGKAQVKYRKDRFNTAPKWLADVGNYLTIFTNFRLAKRFIERNNVEQIWLVQALDVFKPSDKQFFELTGLYNGKISKRLCPWPKGTKMAKRVYLLERYF
jgi:hypothetical protein